jgi:hypothetical protein
LGGVAPAAAAIGARFTQESRAVSHCSISRNNIRIINPLFKSIVSHCLYINYFQLTATIK